MINRKEHLTMEGLQKIVSIRAALNMGLSDRLKSAFPNVETAIRLKVEDQKIKDPYWLAGFSEGEGCFNVSNIKYKFTKSGVQIILRFKITQHIRDSVLMKNIIDDFDCGNYTARPNMLACDFIVSKISDINEKIIPFFDKYPLQGAKALDFEDFKKIVEIINVKGHLTDSGLEEILKIKAGMNKGRSFN